MTTRRSEALGLQDWATLQTEIVSCCRCPRLVAWRESVALQKVARFRDQLYWGRPVPGFGDPQARLWVIGLAPAAHGGNRTGRVFTGDPSGDWLFRALYRAGFANQPTSTHREDGLQLQDCYISAVVRCVPPENRPTAIEAKTCLGYLKQELELLTQVRVIVNYPTPTAKAVRSGLSVALSLLCPTREQNRPEPLGWFTTAPKSAITFAPFKSASPSHPQCPHLNDLPLR
jgi:uracil-DNA glycosylase family 4